MRHLILAILVCLTVSFISPAHAEIIYVRIPVLENNPVYNPDDFADDYLATTGEIWVMLNMEEEAGIRMMMGTWRGTEAHMIELKGRWPMMSWYKQTGQELPPGWVRKEE